MLGEVPWGSGPFHNWKFIQKGTTYPYEKGDRATNALSMEFKPPPLTIPFFVLREAPDVLYPSGPQPVCEQGY